MGKKILIVEDNEKNRKLLKYALTKTGYETIEAENGEMGVHLAREVMPDLVLMDIQMPVMDGIAAIKMLKTEEATARIPVIALTAYAMTGDRERIISETGCEDCILKPVKIDFLLELVKRHVGE